MPPDAVVIPPRRSLALFAALAMLLVVASYVLILLLAVLCVYLPWLLATKTTGFQSGAVLVGGVIIAGSMLWSLLPRPDKFAAPGLRLEARMHPLLFAEIENIASALREPVPGEVYLIPEVNAWVADRGGFLGIGGRRVMAIGLPLLGVLNVSEFRAILAHEFAHYYGGDTRLGPWVRKTQLAMTRTFENMGTIGKAMRVAIMQILYAVVFGILKWYWLFFLRVINSVSRRQEFRADELACIIGGTDSFVSGLRLVHGAGLAWGAFCNQELAPMFSAGLLPPVGEGFAQFLKAPDVAKAVDRGIERELEEGKTDAYDSHPPLRDRITAVGDLTSKKGSEDTRAASCLLQDITITEAVFLHAVFPDVPQELRSVSWKDQGTLVIIPSWTQFVGENAALIKNITAGALFEALGVLPQIAQRIRDPMGMLLDAQQRLQRGRFLLGAALALTLVRAGWALHADLASCISRRRTNDSIHSKLLPSSPTDIYHLKAGDKHAKPTASSTCYWWTRPPKRRELP